VRWYGALRAACSAADRSCGYPDASIQADR
jgi:hypothetical protein